MLLTCSKYLYIFLPIASKLIFMLVHLFPLLYLQKHTLVVFMLHLWPLCQQWCSGETRIMQRQWPSACELHRTALMELPSWDFCARWHKPLASDLSLPVASHESSAWLLMRKLGAECPVILLKRSLCFYSRLHIHFDGSGGQYVSRTLIFSCKNASAGNRIHACGDEHKCFINPFMNHVLHLGQRLVFCSFSGVCALFFVSVLVEAVQNEDLDGWTSYLWAWD